MSFGTGGGLSQDFIEELKFKCDIVSIVSQYIPLTKKGGKYFGCCPFHNEKTGSFCVNTDGQYYHCFGCGASGNVINFVMEMESIGFYDAVKLLADKVGMTMPEFKADPEYGKKKEKKDVLKTLMRDAALYYRANLLKEKEGRAAREYLLNRGINEDVAKHYGLGLSLGYDGLQAYMRRKGYTVENLRDCGLVTGEELADAFANRIIVPIMDGMGAVIAFGGRIYQGEENVAKYKNSTNTLLFDKSRSIYGINFIKREKRENTSFNELILVEGYMDVISLGAAGIRNAVAGMGTALTEGQARELKRLAPNVRVCYDGDGAGRKAAIRNIQPLVDAGMEVTVVTLPDGKDPDDVVKSEGADGFRKYIELALPVIDYKLKLCADAYDLNSLDGRTKYVKASLIVLRDVDSAAEREVYLSVVSRLSGVSVATLASDLKNVPVAAAQRREVSATEKDTKTVKAARFVLNRYLANAPYANRGYAKAEWLPYPSHKAVFEYVTSKEGKVSVSDVFDLVPAEPEIDNIISAEMSFDNLKLEEEYFYGCLLVLANEYLSGNLEFLKKKYEGLSDQSEKRETIVEISKLQQKLKSKNITDKL